MTGKSIQRLLFAVLATLVLNNAASAQYPVNYQYTLLPDSTVNLILAESSGDLAMQTVTALAPYTRTRTAAELKGLLGETAYIMKKLEEYKIATSKLEIVGSETTWFAEAGSLWEVSPEISKLADIRDIPEMLAEGSQDADLKAQLVWVGEGTKQFFDSNPNYVKGKIVVTSANPWTVHMLAMNAGALGTVSYYSPRPDRDPLQIPNTGIPQRGFAFMLPPREGSVLRNRLASGEKIEVQVKINTGVSAVSLQVPQCVIEGKDTTAPEIIFTAHLFEGYVKMGANDNMSGSAVILEVARVLNSLIASGALPKPERSIRFLWVPEFSGTIPWVNRHLQRTRSAMCNINLDMVGLRLRDSRSFLHLHRSGYSTAHFANDVMESYYRYTGETNIEGITDRLGRRGFSRRIVSPSGTDDPFYYRISSLHGSSDNAVFNDWGIKVPGMKMITWPDDYYHTSEDNPDKCDPTQLRRVVFIAASAAYTMAAAGEKEALRILAEQWSASLSRVAGSMARSSDMVWNASATDIAGVYKRAVYNIEGLVLAEKAAVEKITQISNASSVLAMIKDQKTGLDRLLEQNISALKETLSARCKLLGLPVPDLKPDQEEKAAAAMLPVPTVAVSTMGYGGDQKYISKVDRVFLSQHPYPGIVNIDEAAGLADGKRSILQVKKMLDAQFETETPLKSLMNYFIVLREAGLMSF